ncbi:MAG: peptidyl-prolyl cis-trans isomerase [Deltaproteobacteria bacterium CG_4_10_14_0_2_um_filter_43_8]|nr:MAG: peptidyl-prolyl cis-trans isomerase [Deltaproteobacteria bacterium CG11_big_fil_rev_8_21_14_0_20_42_23]PJA19112.1 MAG: peptidyl-prolyl cis-trans isomerase [Deltaproteobacteria bacterium CG_4_10_14_0_2_um_filter_43_8]PJC64948.1 MAG: peptidyl-prolyl cis-trans isomerase [Deltaproteobacteria bacterium CG_4_9_14_0_2_um_filter_42_21]
MLCCFGCSKKEAASSPTQNNKEVMVQKDGWKEPMVANIEQGKKYTAVIKTEKGDVVCELFADAAPLSVTNFKYLADGEFYNGLTFHRVVPNFVIQGGDPTGTGSGGPGYTIKAEIGKSHPKGALAWARTPDEVNPERKSNGSQFYITLEPTPFLDGQYTVFGQVVSGMNVVEKIAMGDKIVSVTVKAE